jgi:hypothetical protein
MNLPDHDAIELAELLNWLADYLAGANDETLDHFNTWAANPNAATDLTADLHQWTTRLLSAHTP